MNDIVASLIQTKNDIKNLIRIATVKEIVYPAEGNEFISAVAIVYFDEESLSFPLRWVTQRAGNGVEYWEPAPGEEVLVVTPSASVYDGIIIGSLFNYKQPGGVDYSKDVTGLHRITYPDGTVSEYDSKTHKMNMHVKGDMTIIVDGNYKLTAKRVDIN